MLEIERPYAVGPPQWFVEPETGLVWLRLAPYRVERLHGPLPDERPRYDPALQVGLPFPLLPGVKPMDAYLHGGATREAILLADGEDHWNAYVLAPFGWAPFPQPIFRRGKLSGLSVHPQPRMDSLDAFARTAAWIREELGPPKKRHGRPPYHHRQTDPRRWAALSGRLEWSFRWGRVVLQFDPRDGEPELRILWNVR